jgi:hypothetical protein
MSFAGIIFLHKSCSPTMTGSGNALNVVMRRTTLSSKRWTAASINFLTQDEMRRLLDVISSKRDSAIFLLA